MSCRCELSPKHLLLQPPLCVAARKEWLIVSGSVVGTIANSSADILKYLQAWVDRESKVLVEGVQLTAVEHCPVELKEGEVPFCESSRTEEPEPPSSPPSSASSSSSSSPSVVSIPVIVGVIVGVLVMIIAVVVCIATVTYCKKKANSRYAG